MLATSREPLRTPAEHLYRLAPLEVPAEDLEDTEDLLATGAVKLFLARMHSADPRFSPDRRMGATIGAICRRLDGIPLAIELAAGRTAALGVDELALRLDDRFKLLTGGQRTALPRQQTLRATLDWSYELLSDSERLMLRRLAVFVGGFTLESARGVIASAEITPADIVESIVNLVPKSLLAVVTGGAIAQYRLLETTRAYALEKLTQSGELQALLRRHAEYFRNVFEKATDEWETRSRMDWLAAYGHQLDNVRAALDWAFSPRGDAKIGVALTVAAVPLWFHLSLGTECGARAEQALASRAQETDRATRRDMQLHAAVAGALLYTKVRGEEINAAWTRALEIAESLDDTDYRLRALWGLWAHRVNSGEYRTALALARTFQDVAASKGHAADALVGDRLLGLTLHFLGDQEGARRHLERVLDLYLPRAQRSDLIRYENDQQVMARSTLAHVLWMQGFPDQAMRLAQSTVEDAQALDHAITLCNALVHAACPVALLNGDLPEAGRLLDLLFAYSANRMSTHLWGLCFEGALLVKRGDVTAGLRQLSSAVDELRERGRIGLLFHAFLADLAQSLGAAGRTAEALVMIDEALGLSERNDERWCVAESLRIKGELLLSQGEADSRMAAETHFRQGLDWAKRQGALSWELRCATSLARLWHGEGRSRPARELLGTVYARFSEGFETTDLTAAKTLLDSLHSDS